jgi:3-oxoacyl-[acyl-carrier protein] reductase
MGVGQLEGRRALVTGGSRGIGAAIVRRLVADGADVVFTFANSAGAAHKLQSTINAKGRTVLALQADNADPEQVAAAVDQAASRLGGLDVLVNNAGVDSFGPIESFPLDEFDRAVAINVRGAFAAIQRAVPHMASGSRIITIGSVLADRVPVPGVTVYAMTKAALGGLTRALARELGPRGISVNLVQPGPIVTDANPESGNYSDAAKNLVALGHYGHPDDVASAVAYLSGPHAGYVSGATWNIDGGSV